MTVVAITGGPGAPGATSAALALLLSWPLTERRRVLLVEADPDGGAVLAGALQGEVHANKGLRHLALSDRRGRLLEEMWDQCIDLSPRGTGDRLLLPGLSDPAQATALVYTWEPLAEACQALDGYGCDVIVDLGRSGGHGPSAVLARRADAVLAVVRTTLRGLSTARPRVTALAAELTAAGAGDALALLLVREGPYAAAEISRTLGVPVVGILPFAPKDARVLSDGGGRTTDRRFQRSELMRAARSTGDELRALTARRRLVPRTAPSPAATAADAGPQLYSPPVPPSDPAPPHGYAPSAPARAPQPAAPAATQDSRDHTYTPPAPAAFGAPSPLPLRAVPQPGAPTPAAPLPPAADATRLGYREAQSPPAFDPAPGAGPAWPHHDPVTAPHPAASAQPLRVAPPSGVVGQPGAGPAWPHHDPVAAPHPAASAQPLRVAPPSGVVGQPGVGPAWPHHDPVTAPHPAASAQPLRVAPAQPAAAADGLGHGGVRPGPAAHGGPGAYPRSVREVLDLAAAAELGAEAVAQAGPVASPIGPVTPGQAARLQAVHLEARADAVDEAPNPFNPPHMVAMPPLADHAPRPPAPEEFRPAEQERDRGDGGTGEVARVR